MNPLLHSKNLDFSFGTTPVLRDISLSVQRGEVVGLVGPNGSGKTTCLKVLAGLLKASGDIFYDGLPLADLNHRQRAALRAYVPQGVAEAFPFSVHDVVAMGLAFQQRFYDPKTSGTEVQASLLAVGCELRLERRFDALSGGEQQQVLIARAFVQGSDLLLLDEPVSFLDLKHRLSVVRALRQRANAGAGVVLSLHDLSLAALACDRLILLKAGTVMATGKPHDVLCPSVLEPVYEAPVCVVPHPHWHYPTVHLNPKDWP